MRSIKLLAAAGIAVTLAATMGTEIASAAGNGASYEHGSCLTWVDEEFALTYEDCRSSKGVFTSRLNAAGVYHVVDNSLQSYSMTINGEPFIAWEERVNWNFLIRDGQTHVETRRVAFDGGQCTTLTTYHAANGLVQVQHYKVICPGAPTAP